MNGARTARRINPIAVLFAVPRVHGHRHTDRRKRVLQSGDGPGRENAAGTLPTGLTA